MFHIFLLLFIFILPFTFFLNLGVMWAQQHWEELVVRGLKLTAHYRLGRSKKSEFRIQIWSPRFVLFGAPKHFEFFQIFKLMEKRTAVSLKLRKL